MPLDHATHEISSLAWVLVPSALVGMLCLSALFSASEAALFSLTSAQRLKLNSSRPSDRAIQRLLANASHLLTCILLCNLAINITFFACANVLATSLTGPDVGTGWSFLFAFATVASVILFGELLPKSVGVLAPLKISRFVSLPMLGIMRVVLP